MRAVEWLNGNCSFINSKVGMGVFSVDTSLEARGNIDQRVAGIIEFTTILILE